MPEQSGSPKVYLVSADQLEALKAVRNPQTAEVVSAIETQTIGSIPERLKAQAGEAKGTVSQKYVAAVKEAVAKVQSAAGGQSAE
jgi:hypothetical protein